MKTVLLLLVFLISTLSYAGTVKTVQGFGSCAIEGMSAEQAKLTALQRARSDAIEKASGVRISSASIVTDGRLAADFIRSYSAGYIIKEQAKWQQPGFFTGSDASAPIIEYRVAVTADVYIPERVKTVRLSADVNSTVFKSGENAYIRIKTAADADIAVFNIRADDTVQMLMPNEHERRVGIVGGRELILPDKTAKYNLTMGTLAGHKADTEAFLVVASAKGRIDFLKYYDSEKLYTIADFYKIFSQISEQTEDVLLAYTVVGG